ncbi:MAG: ABC transporter permease [Pyrinomonadaceae bacterium]|nr:ABC transporter permease [Pyrinomonadaceae bacterium]
MRTLLQDIRYGMRMLLKSPGFTLVAVLALALGIGANTAIFSVVNAVLLRPLPYQDADRLVMVWEHNRLRNRPQNVINPANFLDWQEQSSVFDEMAAFHDFAVNLTGEGEPEQIPGQRASANLFSLLGVQAVVGRTFTHEDAQPNREPLIVISYGLWQRRFGGDPGVIGKTLMLDRRPVTVIGVLPADFKWFIKQGSLVGKEAEFWEPLSFTAAHHIRRGRYMTAVARLKPNVTYEQAQAEMNTIASRLEQQYVNFNTGWGVNLVPLREQFVGSIRPALLVLLGAVGFVLLIACANVANLLLARAAARQKEMATRAALGAGRWRVVRQLLTESVLLAFFGGALGLLLALWGVDALMWFAPQDLLSLPRISINLPVLGFTLLVSVLTGIIFGLVPALEASRLDPSESLKETGRSMTGSTRSRRLRGAFVVAEVALALVLLVSAGLLIKSFMRLQAVDAGFDEKNILTMRVTLPASKYPEENQRIRFFKQTVERLETLPGVRSVGAISFLPFTGPGAATSFTIEGRPAPAAGDSPVTDVRVTDDNYLRTMNIALLRGRTFTEQEATEKRGVVVINEAMVRKYFPGEDPIGKRIIVNMSDTPEPTEIIGVVRDVKQQTLDEEVKAMVYWPHPQLAYSSLTLVMRTESDPLSLATAARRGIQAIDQDQPIADVRTMEQWLATSIARARFNTLLLGLFASVALLLAAIGIYGVMAYSVTQRTHEIGIRMAFGAEGRDVLRLVLGQGMTLVAIGIALGLLGAFAATRVLASLLYGVSATDPMTFTIIPLLLVTVAFIANYIPARRATKVDPMVALRYE